MQVSKKSIFQIQVQDISHRDPKGDPYMAASHDIRTPYRCVSHRPIGAVDHLESEQKAPQDPTEEPEFALVARRSHGSAEKEEAPVKGVVVEETCSRLCPVRRAGV